MLRPTFSTSSPWISVAAGSPRPKLRIFCFPYAGGGSLFYRGWQGKVPAAIQICPVHLPGRERRFQEPAFTDMPGLVQALVPALQPFLEPPFAFFGHSMGAMIGFELARELRRRHLLGPAHLFVSGRRAPHMPDPDPPKFDLPHDEFIEELRTLEGTPPEVLEHPELMELMLPLLRADFELCDTYAYVDDSPLECPISVFGGLSDPETTREELEGWRQHTAETFRLRVFPGNHFFVQEHVADILGCIARDLSGLIAGSR